MAYGNEAAVAAVEIEQFAAGIPDLIPQSDTLYGILQAEADKQPVSQSTTAGSTNRPSFRVPFRVQGGAAIVQGTGTSTDFMGTGNASDWGSFAVSPVWHYAVCQLDNLAVSATDGKGRAKIEYKAEELKNSFDSAMAGLEGVLYGDGSGALTQIPATAVIANAAGPGASITGQGLRAMAVTDNQVVQFFPSEGGASRGYATVSVTSPQTSTIYFVGGLTANGSTPTLGTSLASNVAVNDYIVLQGATGAAPGTTQTSVLGTTAWNNSSTTGSIAGYSRSQYPTRISTPVINLAGGAIQASLSQRIEMILRRTGCSQEVINSGFYLFPEDQSYAVALSNYYNKELMYHESNSKGSDGEVPDASYKKSQSTYGGRKVKLSLVQPTGRVDLLLAKNWKWAELFPLRAHDYGAGVTTVSIPGNGGWYNGIQFSYEAAFNLVNAAPLQGVYVINAQAPFIS